jgi:HD superfamily phosphodiesterase
MITVGTETIKIACEKTRSAELAKCVAEAELERVKGQIGTIICQLTERMEQAASQLAAAEQRAIAAEERANEAEASITHLQAELLAKTIMKKLVPRAA